MVFYGVHRPGYHDPLNYISNQETVNLIKTHAPGCNAIKAGFLAASVYSTSWTMPDPNAPGGTRLGRDVNRELRDLCEAAGIHFFQHFSAGRSTFDFYPFHAERAQIILNADGMQVTWINDLKANLGFYDPSGLDPLNEPHDWNTYTNYGQWNSAYWPYFTAATQAALKASSQTDFLNKYNAFVAKAVDELHAIKPSLVCCINPLPFWDSRASAASPVRRANTWYSSHRYYNGGASSSCAAPSSSHPELVAYWNRNFTEAKRLLYEQLDLKGPGPLINAGLPVNQDEIGINGYCVMPSGGDSHGHLTWMRDMYDYCKAHGIGWFAHNLGPFLNPVHVNKWGLTTSDWRQLNSVGLYWAQNLPDAILDPVTLISAQPTTFTVNGVQYPSGSTLTLPRGTELQFSVPEEI